MSSLPVTVADLYRYVVGVDTHAATHSYAVVTASGALLDQATFPTSPARLRRAADWIRRRTEGELDAVLISAEGTGCYGATLGDVDGYRLTAFATNTARRQLQALERRHRCRARCEDRIRVAKNTGLGNLPLQGFDQNRIWLAIVQLALDLTAWTQLLALHDTDARRWEPKRLRLRVFSIAATLARHGRRLLLHIKTTAPWATLVTTGHARLAALAPP